MPIDQPPPEPFVMMDQSKPWTNSTITIAQTRSKEVLTIAPDGTMKRDGKPIDTLSPEELRAVIVDLVDLLRRR